jgi:carbon-monoxide dehydrogenase large subunit
MLWAARKTGRPVKWMSGRAEAFLCDAHARDHVSQAELALDRDGRFLALRVKTVANLGAYASSHGPVCASILCTQMLMGGYTMPAFHAEVRGVFSNTVCVDAYRGAGQPEAMYLLERIVDKAARELGFAVDELRRRNFVAAARMPYTTPSAVTYDSGDFGRNLDDCLALADWPGFAERRRHSEAVGRLRGIGLASYVEMAAADRLESTDIAFNADGTVTVHIGTMSSGQGHETTYAQLLHEELGIPFERIVIVEGDTDRLPQGGGSGGSRSAQMAAAVIHVTAAKIRDKARAIAAHMLEAAESDIEFDAGAFVIVGTDRALGIMAIAAAARDPANLPEGMAPGLDERGQAELPAATYPNGSHICEVEVDPETGAVAILRYAVVSDFGRVINPLLLAGQVHGGVAQGIGQALLERTVYDADGQLLSGSLMDYCLPRADDLPSFGFGYNEVPCTTNPLGVKGAGEAGTIGALGAVINAIVDALAPLGVRHIDMPATPEQVWRAIRAAASANSALPHT